MNGRTLRDDLPPYDSLQGRWGDRVGQRPHSCHSTIGPGATMVTSPDRRGSAPATHAALDAVGDRLSSLEGSIQSMRQHFLTNGDELGEADSARFGSNAPTPQDGAAAPLRRGRGVSRSDIPRPRMLEAHLAPALTPDDKKQHKNAWMAIPEAYRILNTADEASFDNILESWADRLRENGSGLDHLRYLLVRCPNHDIIEYLAPFSSNIQYYASVDIIDYLAISLFPRSEWIEEMLFWLNKWEAQTTTRAAMQLTKETIGRYERLVMRWGRNDWPNDEMKKEWLLRKLPTGEEVAVRHVSEGWSWQQMLLALKKAGGPSAGGRMLVPTPWGQRLTQPRVQETKTTLAGSTPLVMAVAPEAPVVAPIVQSYVVPTQPAAPTPAPTPALPVQVTQPLGRAPEPHYHASQAAQQQQARGQQGGRQDQRGQHGGRQDQRGGKSQQGQGQRSDDNGPATYPNSLTPVLDTGGNPIPPCARCNKPHRGRCWQCRDHNRSTKCACEIPRLCLNCGMVAHFAETCTKPRPAPPAPAGQAAATPAPATAAPVAPGDAVLLQLPAGTAQQEIERIRAVLAAVAVQELQVANTPGARPAAATPAPPATAPAGVVAAAIDLTGSPAAPTGDPPAFAAAPNQ
eukprot:GHVU01026334.1.p1 GENE.GHVU01026334.1~~GHVU01026334.1.p1  ORF type:complete len:629 (+),score=81.55 GHVU01026334.1:190-2076(+)